MTETERYAAAARALPGGEYHDVIDSTNIRAKELARRGAPEGTCVFSDRQTAGRGRLDRSWLSESRRGIYVSLIARPKDLPAARSQEISFLAALAAADAIRAATGLAPGIKWPNDLVLEGRKVCGILAETGLRPDGTVDWAVAGIGINVFGRDFPGLPWAGSLETALPEGAPRPERGAIAKELQAAWLRWRDVQDREGFAPLRGECARRMLTLGRRVRAERDGAAIEGLAEELCGDGALLLRLDSGEALKLRWGEVSVRGMMGYI